jgi:hypothetical protein
MTDLELRLLHCEREPSEVALYDAADVYREMDDLEMYHGLKYMAEYKKMPWLILKNRHSTEFLWANLRLPSRYQKYDDRLDDEILMFVSNFGDYHIEHSFSDSVRWLGKRLIELGMVQS